MLVAYRVAEDFRESCVGSTSYFISMSLVLLALSVSDLSKFLCHLPTYIWGLFFLYWLYSLFNVVESVRFPLSLFHALLVYQRTYVFATCW